MNNPMVVNSKTGFRWLLARENISLDNNGTLYA
jgi:hypothetical protein